MNTYSHIRYLKYILGVHKKATNLAILSEVARFPLYFSVVIAMIKYAYRLEKLEHGLLRDAYMCNKLIESENINCWYSSIKYLLQSLDIHNFDMSLNKLLKLVKYKLCESFKTFWLKKKTEILSLGNSKLDNYFKLKTNFEQENYLLLPDFSVRRAICRIRISAHDLRIEKDRYSKNYIDRSKRLCLFCSPNSTNAIEDEKHFIMECPLYHRERTLFFNTVNRYCNNFMNLTDESKYFWLFTNEHLPTLFHLGKFIIECLDIRAKHKV